MKNFSQCSDENFALYHTLTISIKYITDVFGSAVIVDAFRSPPSTQVSLYIIVFFLFSFTHSEFWCLTHHPFRYTLTNNHNNPTNFQFLVDAILES